MKNLKLLFLLCAIISFSCKRVIPPTPAPITGPTNFCMGAKGFQYSIAAVNDVSYYMWSVPDDATIASGQGTTSITVNFGKHAGTICVRANNSKEESSDASCLAVTLGCVSNEWCRQTNFPVGRAAAVSFSTGNKGYISTGHNTVNIFKDLWEFDPETSSWTQKADIGGVARAGAVGFSISNKGYLGTGEDAASNRLNDFWEYDPVSNQWNLKAPLPIGRYRAVGFAINGKGYIGTGSISSTVGYSNDFWQYNPVTNVWLSMANFSGSSRQGAVGFSISNSGYIGTGIDSTLNYTNDFWEYNSITNSWSPIATFGGYRFSSFGFSMNGKAYIGAGQDDNGNYRKDIWEYTPFSNSWLHKSDFPGTSRVDATGFSIGDNAFIGTGYDNTGNNTSDFYEYKQ